MKTRLEHVPTPDLAHVGSTCLGERDSLAQAIPFRLGESSSSGIMRFFFAFYRLGETSSPDRDDYSLKTGASHLSDNSSKNLGKFLILSLRREYQVSPLFTYANQESTTKPHPVQFQIITSTIQNITMRFENPKQSYDSKNI
ncbi:hypothetical protein DEO72_LG2g4536 [Vigna unguiculata]|uniref:Uncharacterized protein n=1 Tax=Vigna unguiculata TaxID=3917 RepID=A0A4D6L6T3_VIGUN|nr:hypothetical protein DEO72_LG2g4536 [Vigna unguiculata]